MISGHFEDSTLRRYCAWKPGTGVLPNGAALMRGLRAWAAALAVLAAFAAPALAQTATTLVSNTDNSGRSTSGALRLEQSFGTGSKDATVSEIDVRIVSVNGGVTSVKLREDSGGAPGDLVADFTAPASLTANALNTFTAPANTVLSANTTYWVSLHEGVASNNPSVQITSDTDETGEMDWTIDGRRWRTSETGNWNNSTLSLVMAIKGTVVASAPVVSSATVDGNTLEIVFDKTLDAGSEPATTAFGVTSGSAGINVTNVDIADMTVTLTLEKAVTAAEEIQVRYTKPAANPLRGTDGGEVATFPSQAVTNDTRPEVTGVALVSKPRTDADNDNTNDTYGEGQPIVVDVTWDADVTWDVSEANAGIGVRLTIGSTNKRAELVTGGATSGTARTLRFRYTVAGGDSDTDGVAVTTAGGGKLVLLRHGATLKNARGTRNAKVTHAGLGAQANHLVDGSNPAPGNSAPEYNGDDPGIINAPSNTLVNLPVPIIGEHGATTGFHDPDGDLLTYTVSPDRDDVYYLFRYVSGRIYFGARADCVLANLTPPISSGPHDTVVTMTATDPDGATVSVTATYRTEVTCPSLSSAVVKGTVLTLTLDGNPNPPPEAPADEVLAADEFEVKVGGTAVALAATNPVMVSGSTVTLILAEAPAAGAGVTVSYAPGDYPAAAGFVDRPVTVNTTQGPPVPLTVAVTDGQTLTLTFDENLVTPGAQALSDLSYAFSVTGLYRNGVRHRNLNPNRVAVSGPTVTLTFGGVAVGGVEALPGRTVTVGYDAAMAEEFGASLQDAAGEKVTSFEGRTATRPAMGPIPPVLTAAQTAGTALTLTFDRALDAGSAPAGSRFRVLHLAGDWDGPDTLVSGTGTASVSGTTVTVTLAEAVPQDRFARVAYTKGDDANPLRGASAGPKVADVSWFTATALDRTAPELVSGAVAGTRLALYYNEALDTGSTPATGDFTVTAGGNGQTVSGVSMSASAVTLTLGSAVAAGQTVTVTYTAGTHPVQDVEGIDAANLTNKPVTNLGPSDPGKPALAATSPAVAADTALTLTFDRDLDPAHVPAARAFTLSDEWKRIQDVAVRGKTVELVLSPGTSPCEEPLTVTYNKRGTNALRNLWGTQADGFTGQAVTNARACTYGSVTVKIIRIGPGNRRAMNMQFDRPLDRRRALGRDAFRVRPRDTGRAPIGVEDAGFSADGRGVELALSRALAGGERVTVNYRPPRDSTGLWDADGNQVGAFSAEATAPGGGPAALTAAFVDLPAEHNGKKLFTFELRFSENFPGRLRYKLLRDEAFQVTNGRVRVAKRVAKDRNQRWLISVRPASFEDVIVTLPAATDCAAAGAVCTEAGRKLSSPVTATVPGPAALSVADAEAEEGTDAAIEFAVSLSRAAAGPVTVDYTTVDGTAKAGEDYAATSGTLTFAAGELAKTVAVPVRDDAIDEGRERFRLRLSNAKGARIADGVAVGTIVNNDPLQRAWLSRFGRTVGTHVVDAVGERLRGAPDQPSHLTIGGVQVPLRQGRDPSPQPSPSRGEGERGGVSKAAQQSLSPGGRGEGEGGESAGTALLEGLASILGLRGNAGSPDEAGLGMTPDPRLSQGQPVQLDLRQVLLGSAFRLNLNGPDSGAATPRLTAWGRVAGTTFQGTDGQLALDGNVITGTVGLDAARGRWLGGVAVAHSQGDGTYTLPLAGGQRDRGDLEQTLTSLQPYLRYAVTDRLDVWGLLGYGWGELEMARANGGTIETDTSLLLGALGGRGLLLAPEDTGGFQLATRTDAMFTRTSSEAAANSAATDADAHRLRVILEGSRGFAGAAGQTFTPTVELGLRHDWGDAETGFGVELGGRVQYAHPGLGLTIDAAVRGLLAHEDDDYNEWGASGTVRLAPGVGGQGLSLTLAPAWGATASGVQGLWTRQTTAGLAPQGQRQTPAGRLAAEVGYGLALWDTGLVMPYAGTVLAEGADRTYRLGARWHGTRGLTLNLEGTRQEHAGPQPLNQGLRLEAGWRF